MNVFSQVTELLLAFMEIAICYRIICEILFARDELRKKEKIFFAIVALILGIVLYMNRKIVFISFSILLIIAVTTILSFWMIKKNDFLSIVGIVATYYLMVALAEVFLAFMNMNFLKYKFDFLIYAYATSFWKCAIYLFVGILVWCVYITIKKKNILKNIDISAYRKIMLTFSAILYIILIQYLGVLEKMSFGEQEMQGTFAGVTLLLIVGVFSFIAILLMKYKSVQEENFHFMIQDELYKRNSEEMNSIIQINRENVHNIKNHLIVMKRLGEENDIERLREYINNLCMEYKEMDERSWTGNRVLDMILSQKKVVAEQKAIEFGVKAMLLPDIKISDVEICALFGNVLDNSIEACNKVERGDKFIKIKIEMKEKMLLIRVENSVQEQPVIEEGEFITSKEDKNIHGLGMKSVKRVVDKYDGAITYQLREKTFVLVLTFFDMI